MGLTTCHECGHEVSDRAPTCPSCGVEDPAGTGAVPSTTRVVSRAALLGVIGCMTIPTIIGLLVYIVLYVIAPSLGPTAPP